MCPTFAIVVRRILAVILLLCVTCQCVVKLGIVAWYEWNKQYVATVLCENRDKPQMHCCGKCYLNKQLNKVDNDNDKNGGKNLPSKWEKTETAPFILPEIFSLKTCSITAITTHHAHYTNSISFSLAAEIFHPPSC